MDRKIRVLAWGDWITPTGFSRVNSSIFGNLLDKLDLVCLGVNYRGDPHNTPFRVFPAGLSGDVYGLNRLQEFVSFQPDIIFMINDAWVLNPMLSKIKEVFKEHLPEVICYIPVDAEDHDPDWYKNFDIVTVPVAYTEWGKQVILKASPDLTNRIQVVSHGVDTDLFYPIDKLLARVKLFGEERANTEDFIFLSASRNQPRKKLDILMSGFKLFSEGKPGSVRLYMHAGATDSSIDIPKFAIRLGIDKRLILTSLVRGIQQVPEERLNLIYNATNVGVNTSLGEGFSLTNIEHSVTGSPQIIPDHSALSELYKDCGIFISAKINYTLDNIMTTGKLVVPEDVATAMERIYTDSNLYSVLSNNSMSKFTGKSFQWKTISEIWYSIFEKVMEQ